jgi:UDP-N-acetylmuramoyl-tripeptide--D-alanyl-D-alanine ligase
MVHINLDDVVKDTGAQTVSVQSKQFAGVGTDTREDVTGQLFVALKGDIHDAHSYVEKAVEKKAAGVLIHRWSENWEKFKGQVTFLMVPDTLKALQDLGKGHRQRMRVQILSVTGSNGKTTTKEFAAALLSPYKRTHWSTGSFNNHWGVPLTLLKIEKEHRVAVVEMGMNHAGEITQLVNIADPDAVVCTMVGRAHIEHFGNIEKIAEAKEEIYQAAREDTIRIFNLDDPLTVEMRKRSREKFGHAEVISFSQYKDKADLYMNITHMDVKEIEVSGRIAATHGKARIPVFGKQNLTNILAGAALAHAGGLSGQQIWEALPNCKTNWGRNQWLRTKSGVDVIFDAYNANPDSMQALLENTRALKREGRIIGVFAQMRELGNLSPGLHEELGKQVAQTPFSSVYFYGPDYQAFEKGFLRGRETGGAVAKVNLQPDFDDKFADMLRSDAQSGDLVVFKGSRGMKMERMLEPLEPVGDE